MPISCEDCREQFSELLAEDASVAPEVTAHLVACPECSRDLSMLRQVRAELQSLPMMPAPVDLRARVRAELQQSVPQRAPEAVLPVSPRPGLLAGLSSFFNRPANVAWTSGLALAAFCLLLVARPQQIPMPVVPDSASAPQEEVAVKAQERLSSPRDNVKAVRPKTAAPGGGPARDGSTPSPTNSAKYTRPQPRSQAAPPQIVSSPKTPSTLFYDSLPSQPHTMAGPRAMADKQTRREKIASEPSAAAAMALPRTVREPQRQPGKAELSSKILQNSVNSMISEAPVAAPSGAGQRAAGQPTLRQTMPQNTIAGAGTDLTAPFFNRTLTGAAPRPRVRQNEPAGSTRQLVVRLEWLPADERREADQGKEEALSKSVIRGGGGGGGGEGGGGFGGNGPKTNFGVGAEFGAREPSDESAGDSKRAAARAGAANAAPAAAPGPAAGARGPQGPAGPPGPVGGKDLNESSDSRVSRLESRVTAPSSAKPSAERALDSAAPGNVPVQSKAKSATANTPADAAGAASPPTAAPRRLDGVATGLFYDSRPYTSVLMLKVGEQRRARVTVVPPHAVPQARVVVHLGLGLSLDGQGAGGGTHTLWSGNAQAGHAIVIPLSVTAVLPGAQSIQVSLRAAGDNLSR